MYRYIKQEDLEKLVREDRQAWVVYGVSTKDKEEYINNILISLRQRGFNTELLTQCSIFKLNTNYNVLLTLRKNAKLDQINKIAIEDWSKAMGNVFSIKEFMQNMNKLKSEANSVETINCMVDTGHKKSNFVAIIRFIKDVNGDIVNACVISPKFMEIHGYKVDTSDCKRNIPKLVEKVYGMLYRRYKYTINRCSYKVGSKLLKYNIVPTQSGIKLDLVS